MRIGVPTEIKTHEYRVGLTPAGARELVLHGHQVVVQRGAAAGIGIADDAYRAAGAEIATDAEAVFSDAELIVKVKEPQPAEIARLRTGQVLFTYLHLAADKVQTEGLIRSGATCIAYETVTDKLGGLPLLSPMSEVAGRMSVQVGAHCLEREQGGAGILLGGVPGVPPARVVVIGGGVAGTNAARMAVGLEASVIILDRSLARLKELDLQFGPRATTEFATSEAIERAVLDRRGSGAGCRRAEIGDAGDAAAHAARLGAGRYRDRPGRLFRNQPADDALGADLCRGRRGALLRHQYAGGGGAHVHVRADQCDFAVRDRSGNEGLARRAARRSAFVRRPERACGPGDLCRGGA
jgi:hypothetical protein